MIDQEVKQKIIAALIERFRGPRADSVLFEVADFVLEAVADERARCVRLIRRMDDAYDDVDLAIRKAIEAIERGDE